MRNKDRNGNGSHSNSSGETPCCKCNRANCCAECCCRDAYRLVLENQDKLLKKRSEQGRALKRLERSLAAIIAHINLNTEEPANKVIVDNRVLSVMKSTMISAAVERLLKGDGKTSRIIREVFESYRDRPGAYDSYASFERQVFRFWEKY